MRCKGFGRERRIVAYDLGDFAQNLRRCGAFAECGAAA